MPRRARGKKIQKKDSPLVRFLIYGLFLGFAAIFLGCMFLANAGIISSTQFLIYATIAQSMLFSLVVFAYMTVKGKTFKQIISDLGLKRSALNVNALLLAALLFLAVFALEIGISQFQAITGIPLPTNVQQVFAGLPFYFIIFTVVVAPINEEILFRGFLVPAWWIKMRKHSRAWAVIFILISALVFASLHYLSYNSISEFAAALFFGLLAGYVRNRFESLYPSIIAHMAVNFLGLILLAILL